MSYIAPIHRPSSIREAIRIRLWEGEEVLVTAKANRIEISRVGPNGVALITSATVCGTVTLLQALQVSTSPNDRPATDPEVLFVGTDQFEYFTARWDPATRQLVTEEIIEDISEPHMRETESQNKCLADPNSPYLIIHAWEGVMNVMRGRTRKSKDPGFPERKSLTVASWDQVRLKELFIKSSTFVATETGHPTIAFLYQTSLDKEDAILAVYRLMKDDKDTETSKFEEKDREMTLPIPDPYARILIPVPRVEPTVKRYHKRDTTGSLAQLGGLLVVGETLIVYVDTLTKTQVTQTLDEPKVWVAWAEYDPTHYLLADDYGFMYLLTIEVDDVTVLGMSLARLGKTSRASSLVYMFNNMVFLGSHHGDSQLFAIDLDSRRIQLIQTVPNIAPILDFTIMDLGSQGNSQANHAFSSGQARIVAGCGVHHNGSLRSIRSSVGLEAIGILGDFEGVRGLFPLKSQGSKRVDLLLVSFLTESRLFVFRDDGEIEEVYDARGMVLDEPTLAAISLPNGLIFQANSNSARLVDPVRAVCVNTWSPATGRPLVSVSCNEKWALVSLGGSYFERLDLTNEKDIPAHGTNSIPGRKHTPGEEISCVHVSPDMPDIGVIGTFMGGVVVIRLGDLWPLQSTVLSQDNDHVAIPRDLALVQLHSPETSPPTLFIAMQNGQVVSMNVDRETLAMSSKNTVTLGSMEAGLHVLPHDEEHPGQRTVFATTEHSSLIYSSEGRIIYSAAAAEDVTLIAPFDSEAFPGAVVMATDKSLAVSMIDPMRRTHVNPLHIGETVRRVAHAPVLGVFGLGTIKKELVGDEEVVTSWFQLVDEVVLGQVGKVFALDGATTQFPGHVDASGTEIVEAVISAELEDSSGDLIERFIVGTSYLPSDEGGAESGLGGRILVLGVDENTNPYLIAKQELKGACRSLKMMDGMIVAGLSKTVVIYKYEELTADTKGTLKKLATYRPSTVPIALDVWGNKIGVADLTQSLALLEYVPADGGKAAKLVEKARHFQFVWATATASLSPDTWLEADAQGNVLVLETNPDAPTEHDVKQMRVTSEIHLGEQVNQIRKLEVSDEKTIVVPRAFLGTVEGSLYMYATISPEYQSLLLPLQERIAEVIRFLGQSGDAGTTFAAWRGFKNAKRAEAGPFRFVDGELIERFLDLDEMRQESVVEGLGPSVEDVKNIVEELRRMH
ncbi:mono-functional DNA-alkylating methyl methanesulfonate N-term-domain-containing protein [Plectosphaerella plurivora]|uniref:Mono-functional DNA-alkylating methyl methanesulfonate N-term-domain-containing protein n=1 Tax=Plectosphaerella plurivora TaxID=936078 RepID=A0A9P8V8C9_9PEZI|nr:mono-functional DNA-alkylating methyl methanesulfonate N-term-domain-containing protein [Plectosphaerella plurivora]